MLATARASPTFTKLLTRAQLGETFNATVVLGLSQDAPSSPRNIRLHVELQAPSGTRVALLERKADALAEEQALESQITHEVKEVGLHALVCSIAYKSGPDDQADRQLRKLYRFTATSPCSVKVRESLCRLSDLRRLSATERARPSVCSHPSARSRISKYRCVHSSPSLECD